MYCGNCSKENVPSAQFCYNCGTALSRVGPTASVPQQVTQRGLTARQPSRGVAVVLSVFIPGAGQLYNGDWKKGLAFIAVVFFGVVSTAGLAYPVIVIVSAIDAYLVAQGTWKRW